MYTERLTSRNTPTLAEAVMGYLERTREDGMTWKERLFRAYFKYAVEGNATYARIIMDALSHECPEDLNAAYPMVAEIVETDEPLTFHSELRAFMMEQGRFYQFIQAITTHAVKGAPTYGKILEQLAQIDPPTRKDLAGQILIIDGFGGQLTTGPRTSPSATKLDVPVQLPQTKTPPPPTISLEKSAEPILPTRTPRSRSQIAAEPPDQS